MRGVRAALVAAVMVSLLASSVALGAAQTPAGGKVKIAVENPDSLKSRVVVVGAIGDYGTAISQDKNGKPDINGAYEKFTLKRGGFTVDATGLNKALDKAKPRINLSTCSVEFGGSGPGTISKGTGLYAGISGKLTISVNSAAIVPRKKNGKCNLAENAKPLAEFDTVAASGTVSF